MLVSDSVCVSRPYGLTCVCVCHAPNLGAVPSQLSDGRGDNVSGHSPTSRAGSRDIGRQRSSSRDPAGNVSCR
eukprot:5382430-Prymnesium_polylepis.2